MEVMQKHTYLLILFCLLGILPLKAETKPQTAVDSAAFRFNTDDVKVLRQSFVDGAEVYYGKLLGGKESKITHVMSSVETYLDYLACQDYKTIPEWERKALSSAQRGRVEEALTAYQEQNLMERYPKQPNLYPSVERYVVLLQLSGIRQYAREGLNIMEQVMRIDTVSFRPLSFLVNIGQELHLQSSVDEYLDIYQKRATDDTRLAQILNIRGLVAYRRNRPNESLAYNRQSAALFERLAKEKKDPSYCVLHRARNYFGMSRNYYRLGQAENSVRAIRACRDCYAIDANDNEQLLQRILALSNLAPMAADQGAFFLADSIYQEVDQLGSWLFEGNVQQETNFFFNSLRLRGLVAYRVGKFDEAESLFNQALDILNKQEAAAPGQNIENFENIYFNMASLYYAKGNIPQALDINRKVLKMVQECKVHDESHKRHNLAYCYKYIGNCLWALAYQKYLDAKKHRVKEVTKYYQEAIDNYKIALTYNPNDVEAIAKLNLGQLIMAGMEKPMAMPKNF